MDFVNAIKQTGNSSSVICQPLIFVLHFTKEEIVDPNKQLEFFDQAVKAILDNLFLRIHESLIFLKFLQPSNKKPLKAIKAIGPNYASTFFNQLTQKGVDVGNSHLNCWRSVEDLYKDRIYPRRYSVKFTNCPKILPQEVLNDYISDIECKDQDAEQLLRHWSKSLYAKPLS